MMKKIIIVILEILLGSVVMAQMPVKNTIPGKEVVLLPEMSDRAFWEHCMAIEQRERIIALGSQVLISSPVLPGEKLYAEYFRNGNRSNYEKAYSIAYNNAYMQNTA